MLLLANIQSPAEVKLLSPEELKQLASELRAFLVSSVAETGGHLASSLGAVELALALCRVFQPPQDAIVWDVGHQAYAYKILTGRRDRFRTLRRFGGLCGFPRREENPCDAFNTGHSSTSISAALGLARARDLAGGLNRVVAVIGDGSISNGLAWEGLNDAGHRKTDLLVILNDNRMSISKPVGGLSNYLNRIITGSSYNRLKQKVENLVASIPKVGQTALRMTNTLEELVKGLLVPGVLFEELGFRYLGPIDGHDLDQLLPTLERVRNLTGPILLHVITRKGKGFEHAERNPEVFHGTPPFDVATGRREMSAGMSYSKAFSDALLRRAREDRRIVAITAAMTSGTVLDEFAEQLPERFFDVGIAEGHAVTMAAGLAAGGYRPVVAVYSTFMQRAYDNLVHDVCLQNLPVILALDRAGLVGEDGPTHHGVFDIAYLRHMPNMAVFAPSSAQELAGMLRTALKREGPTAIRYPRGAAFCESPGTGELEVPLGRARVVREGGDVAIFGLGNMLQPALAAAAALERKGVRAAVIDPRSVKPLDAEILTRAALETGAVLTVEDHALAGGFGSAVLELFRQQGVLARMAMDAIGLPDVFIEHGSVPELFRKYGLTAEAIEARCLRLLEKKPRRLSGTGSSSGAPDETCGAFVRQEVENIKK